jgi:hypothetical protein
VSGAPGGKNGPPANATTTGINQSVQQQDSSGVKGLTAGKQERPSSQEIKPDLSLLGGLNLKLPL